MLWEYRVLRDLPFPPPEERRGPFVNPDSPFKSVDDVKWALETLDREGWEFVGTGQKHWLDAPTQTWWIFRRPQLSKREPEGRP